VALPQGTWSLTDPARTIAARIGAEGARTYRYELGVSQQEVINEALLAIGRARPTWSWWSEARPGPGSARGRRGRHGVPSARRHGDAPAGLRGADRDRPASSGRRCSSTRSLRTRWPTTSTAGNRGTPPGRGGAVGPLQPGGAGQPPRRLSPAPAVGRRHRHARAEEPPAGLSLQQVALQPVDRRPGRRAPLLLGRAGAGRRRAHGPVDLPPRGPARVRGHHVDGPAGPARLARHGRAGPRRRGTAGPAPGRAVHRRGVLVLPGRRPGAATRPRPGPRRDPDRHRRHVVRRRALQQLRAERDRDRGRAPPGHAVRTRSDHHGVGDAVQAGPGRVVRLAPRHGVVRGRPGRIAGDRHPQPARGAARQSRWPGRRGLLHRDLRRRRSTPAGPDGDCG
jgi:hypothetical protein